MTGIYVANSFYQYVKCNNVSLSKHGFFFDGNNSISTKFMGNIISNSCKNGFTISGPGAGIGTQGNNGNSGSGINSQPADNIFLNAFPPITIPGSGLTANDYKWSYNNGNNYYSFLTKGATAANSSMWVRNLINYDPSQSSLSSGTGVTSVYNANNTYYVNNLNCDYDVCNPGTNGDCVYPRGINANRQSEYNAADELGIENIIRAIRGEWLQGDFNAKEQRQYVMEQQLYSLIQTDAETFASYPTIAEFLGSKIGSNMQALYLLEQSLGNGEIDQAKELFERIVPVNIVEENTKKYYGWLLKLNDAGELTEDDLNQMQTLGMLCPDMYGMVIYGIRNLYNAYAAEPAEFDLGDCVEQQGRSIKASNFVSNTAGQTEWYAYPNPATQVVNLYCKNSNGNAKKITLVNLFGKKLAEYKLSGQQKFVSISLQNTWPSGVYVATIVDEVTGQVSHQKIVKQ